MRNSTMRPSVTVLKNDSDNQDAASHNLSLTTSGFQAVEFRCRIRFDGETVRERFLPMLGIHQFVDRKWDMRIYWVSVVMTLPTFVLAYLNLAFITPRVCIFMCYVSCAASCFGMLWMVLICNWFVFLHLVKSFDFWMIVGSAAMSVCMAVLNFGDAQAHIGLVYIVMLSIHFFGIVLTVALSDGLELPRKYLKIIATLFTLGVVPGIIVPIYLPGSWVCGRAIAEDVIDGVQHEFCSMPILRKSFTTVSLYMMKVLYILHMTNNMILVRLPVDSCARQKIERMPVTFVYSAESDSSCDFGGTSSVESYQTQNSDSQIDGIEDAQSTIVSQKKLSEIYRSGLTVSSASSSSTPGQSRAHLAEILEEQVSCDAGPMFDAITCEQPVPNLPESSVCEATCFHRALVEERDASSDENVTSKESRVCLIQPSCIATDLSVQRPLHTHDQGQHELLGDATEEKNWTQALTMGRVKSADDVVLLQTRSKTTALRNCTALNLLGLHSCERPESMIAEDIVIAV